VRKARGHQIKHIRTAFSDVSIIMVERKVKNGWYSRIVDGGVLAISQT
jgi:hypothetical protein